MHTIPDFETLSTKKLATPDFMFPNDEPWLVIEEGTFPPELCETIIAMGKEHESYNFHGCKADTVEFPIPLGQPFDHISGFLMKANELHWKYELGHLCSAWLQTYGEGGLYNAHMDGTPGQTRKLTAIVQLSDQFEYQGGQLIMHIPPHRFIIPKKQGTVVIFPHWVTHEVSPIRLGVRHSINLGAWGPPFR